MQTFQVLRDLAAKSVADDGSHPDVVILISDITEGGPGWSNIELAHLSPDRSQLEIFAAVTRTTSQLIAALVSNLAWFYYTDEDWQTYVAAPPHLLDRLKAADERVRRHLTSARQKVLDSNF